MNNYISTESLTNGEQIALSILEVTAIPHISIIDDKTNAIVEATEHYKIEMCSLLNEVHQSYKSISTTAGYSKDISVELLWATSEIENQPYNAQIRLFVLIRAIDVNADMAEEIVKIFVKLFKSTLSLQRYDFREIPFSELAPIINKTNDTSIKAIVKEEKSENLQNQLLPYCYSYDRILLSNNDLSRIVNVLIDYPDCAVSMQLIPTVFENNEAEEIDRITQTLETLSKGVMDQGIGNISFALAEKHAEVYRYYSEHKSNSVFLFNIVIYGNNTSISNITSRVYGQLSSGIQGSANLKTVDLDCFDVNKNNNFYPLPWAINELLLNKDRNNNLWMSNYFPKLRSLFKSLLPEFMR